MPNIVFNIDLMYRVYLHENDVVQLPVIKELVLKQLQRQVPAFVYVPTQDIGLVTTELVIDGFGSTAMLEHFIGRLKKG